MRSILFVAVFAAASWGHSTGSSGGWWTGQPRAEGQQSGVSQCTEPIPAGFVSLETITPRGPWVFDARGSSRTPLPALQNVSSQSAARPVAIRLDDGTHGMLRVESRPCAPGEDCTPEDCGCPLADESYWVEVVNAAGTRVARMHLWAAYGLFEIVLVDLVDGPGDELLIVRVPAHASPPIGHDVKIWKPGQSKPIELATGLPVAGPFGTSPIGCARWRSSLDIDTSAAKPRAIVLRSVLGSTGCCRLQDDESSRATALRAERVLRFDQNRRAYVATSR